MIKYKFYNTSTKHNSTYNLIKVEEPYDFMSQMFEGNESSEDIARIINGIQKVKSGKQEDYSFGNQGGFDAYVLKADPTDLKHPEGGVAIIDFFGPEELLYVIPFQEMLKILEEFKAFLIENGR